jgi:spermidine synthase
MVLLLVAVFFVVSGACGLMYETVWMKQVSYVFGNTVTASTVVLGTFMGGLALGSWLPGKRIDRLTRPLTAYGWLEIGIALSSTMFSPALDGVRYLDRAVLVPAGVSGPALFAFEMLAVAVLLLVPCALMGATLPVLCRFAVPRLDNPGRTMGFLYAANSAGAVVGGLLAGFWMIEALGLNATVHVAQALNVLVGVASLTASRLTGPVAPVVARATEKDRAGSIHVHVFLCGFSAMLFEIALMKLLPLIVGSSTQSFSLMICAFITGLAAGSATFGASFARRPARPATMGTLMLVVGLLFMVSLPLYNHLPAIYVAVRSWARVPYGVFQTIGFGMCFAVMFLPTFFLGGVLPAAAELVARRDTIGRDVGRLYAANTIGNILGTIATGLVLVPSIGFKRTMEVGVALNVLSGLTLVWRDGGLPIAWRLTGTAAVAGLLAGYAMLYPELDVNALTAGVYRHVEAGGSARDAIAQLVAKRRMIYQREDGMCFVTVTETPSHGLSLSVNGKVDASSGLDMRNQKLAGHFPMLFHRAPRDVLVIGLGSGVTVAAVLKHGPVRVICPEISPAVVEAARLFGPWNDRVHDDKRVSILVDDGRNFVERTRERFDVIVSEPSNPWIAGIASLYTVEFFRTVRDRLAPGGVMAQFLQLYDMDVHTFRLVLRTVRMVFPHVLVM